MCFTCTGLGTPSGSGAASDGNSSSVHAPPAAPAEARRSGRVATEPERFSDSKYSKWSAYDMDRRDERHERIWDQVDEAAAAEPALKDELDALFARVHSAATAPSGSTSAGVLGSEELKHEMGQAAAACLHSALLEMLAASANEELPHIWAGLGAEATPTLATFQVRMGPAGCGSPGQLAVAPPNLTFTPVEPPHRGATSAPATDGLCMDCMETILSWPLTSFAGVHDDAEEAERFELRLLQGEDDGLLFGFETA
eukprot:7386970-Prymnesium_polylepis.1